MRLTIEGRAHVFTPIKSFREAHQLPPEFGVALFEPKDYSGLGRIDQAGAALNGVRMAVLAAMPTTLSRQEWLGLIPELTRLFTDQLYAINAKVKLHDVEIEFAAAGFSDVCQAVVYAMLRARNETLPPFEAIYGEWLDQTARVSQTVHRYGEWQVQIVTHAYGRAGLMVQIDEETAYVQDGTLGCPAEGTMAALLAEVAARMMNTPR